MQDLFTVAGLEFEICKCQFVKAVADDAEQTSCNYAVGDSVLKAPSDCPAHTALYPPGNRADQYQVNDEPLTCD